MVKYLRKALLFIALGKRRPLAELKLLDVSCTSFNRANTLLVNDKYVPDILFKNSFMLK